MSDIAEEIALCVTDIKAESGNEDIIVPDPANYLTAEERFNNTDTSGDGVVDLDEFLAKVERKVTDGFNSADTDGDMQVTWGEFRAHKAARKATRRAVRSCVEELSDTLDMSLA